MNNQPNIISYHHERSKFADAIQFTAAETGFSARLVEKDYYCSVVLGALSPLFHDGLIFKGGTALSKVHAQFHRLSEDLDFGLSISADSGRGARRNTAAPIKAFLQNLTTSVPDLRASVFVGKFESRHYFGLFYFRSLITGEEEPIKVEVSLREPAVDATVFMPAHTLLLNPLTGKPAVEPFSVRVLSLQETYAEKARAALSRDNPAIRDFYDISVAILEGTLDVHAPEFVALVKHKMTIIPGLVADLSSTRTIILQDQVGTHLEPVLRATDLAKFQLEHPLDLLGELLKKL
jgi:predicted nucleotidyltransferase component of viral defense system